MLTVSDLSYSYRSKPALTDVAFSVTKRTVGVLGENGAGKTTLFELLAGGLRLPRAATVEPRGLTSYCPQALTLPPGVRVEDFLLYVAWLKGVRAPSADVVGGVLEAVDLAAQRGSRIGELSGGMQRRLQIAQSLLATPEVLLLDEPTAGLDPIQRQRVLDLVGHLPGPQHVLISTHILADLLGLAEEVVVLHRGRVAALWSWDVDAPPDEAAVTGELVKIVGVQ
ncbi:hypothetical protein GCM10027053_27920 [Intrasporangium mesophilum]